MSEAKRIKTALVSVYHKEGLNEIITKLHEEGVQFLSTGGTRQFIESLGYPCQAVEDLTTYPSILGGRVKTLHPKVFGGILCRRGLEQDIQQIEKYGIPEIDLVIVDLYPFEATVASGACEADVIEKIDIGGISLIRAAAKNYNDVVIVASQAQYQPFRDMLTEHGATTTLEERRWLAKEAFAVSSNYDSAIFNYFDGEEGSAFRYSANDQKALRYGENPHQKGYFYGNLDAMFDHEVLGQKKNRIILVRKPCKLPKKQFRSLLNGVLVQERDLKIETPEDLKPVTDKLATPQEVEDMLFANKIVKNSKSNSIVLAKGKQLLASGVGQTSRVDALKQAIEKAKGFGFDLHGAVMASDAFFPFPDCVEIAGKEGITAVIQPGGSIKDQLSFDYCNEHGIAMVTTGFRHFKH